MFAAAAGVSGGILLRRQVLVSTSASFMTTVSVYHRFGARTQSTAVPQSQRQPTSSPRDRRPLKEVQWGEDQQEGDAVASAVAVPEPFQRAEPARREQHQGGRQVASRESTTSLGDTAATNQEDTQPLSADNIDAVQRNTEQLDDTELWSQRKKDFSVLQRRLLLITESHHSDLDKVYLLLAVHREIMDQRMRLREDTYESLLSTLLKVSIDMSIPGAHGGSSSSPSTGAQTIRMLPFVEDAWKLYRYMVDSGTPVSMMSAQHMMQLLERCKGGTQRKVLLRSHGVPNARQPLGGVQLVDALTQSRAHSIMLDLDRMNVRPSDFTINSYFTICAQSDSMHLALSRYLTLKQQHHFLASPGTCTILLNGFLQNGRIEQAMTFASTLINVRIDGPLMNTMLLVAQRSPKDPLSAFAMYEGMMGSGIPPSAHTVDILLSAWLKAVWMERYSSRQPAGGGGGGGEGVPPQRQLYPSIVAGSERRGGGGEEVEDTFDFQSLVAAKYRPSSPESIGKLLFLLNEVRAHHVRCNPKTLNKFVYALHLCSRPFFEEHPRKHQQNASTTAAAGVTEIRQLKELSPAQLVFPGNEDAVKAYKAAQSLLGVMRGARLKIFQDLLHAFQ